MPLMIFLLIFLVIILQPLLLPCETATTSGSDDNCQIITDSTLSPSSSSLMFSTSGRFAFGFHPEGDGFTVGILFIMAPNNTTTLIWNHNRDDAPVSNSAMLKLTKDGLMLLLSSSEGSHDPNWLFSDNSSSTHCASMLDSGNFAIFNSNNSVLWQTFDHPTDTIMGGQTLQNDRRIVSSVSETNHSNGKFLLVMQGDNNLVMYLRGDVQTVEDAYWASNTVSKQVTSMSLDKDGVLYLSIGNQSRQNLTTNGDGLVINNTAVVHRARLEPHGLFQVYSHDLLANTSKVLQRLPDIDQCTVRGVCGPNSYCILSEDQTTPQCPCLPGFQYTNPNNPYEGCRTTFIPSYCAGTTPAGDKDSNYTIDHVVFNDNPIATLKTFNIKEGCFNSCLEDCECEAAQYRISDGSCWKHSLPLRFGRQDSNNTNLVFIRGGREMNTTRSVEKNLCLVVLVPVVSVLISIILLLIFIIFKFRVLRYRLIRPREELGLDDEIAPRFFSLHELCEATKGFKEELGKGAFGTVFKGMLFGKTVAVKRLEKVVEEGEKEFRTEMKMIGRTHHRNLVKLLGFCNQGSHRLLVYKFMSNGSLADLIFKRDQNRPDWTERFRIALDVARGIHYLHEDCETHIIHCDIKPENILMDDDRRARISDFGLAKLLMPSQTKTITGIRGTRGYLAPEWYKNMPINLKADVYSFGVVLLEILCCRKNMDWKAEPDEMILSEWVCKCYFAGELEKLRLDEDVDMVEFEKAVKVGLWCIQTDPTLRPSMKNVIIMLEGCAEISSPPNP